MTKLLAVLRREYRETVRKRSFIVLTILTPLLFFALMFVPQLLAMRSAGDKDVLVLDGTGTLSDVMNEAVADASRRIADDAPASVRIEVVASADPSAEAQAALDRVRSKELDAILAVPRGVLDGVEPASYYSRSATDIVLRPLLSNAVSRAVTKARLAARGIEPGEADRLVARVEVDAHQVTREGTEAGGGRLDFLFAFGFAAMLLLPMIIHGQEIMRGVIQEKTDRVVETLISSMSAFELLTGKVLGMACVGLTQITIWIVMGAVGAMVAALPAVALGPQALNLLTPMKAVWFVVFYLLGYLIYASVYASGGACVNSEKEAQQVLMPVILVLMLPWFVLVPIVSDPDSTLATVLSLFPLFAPITMFVRVVVSEPPMWQVLSAVLVSVATIAGMFWIASRIFRVGILWYGKRPSLPEFVRWVRQP